MKNLFDDYAKAVSTWAAHTSTNAIARSVTALDKMRKGEYTTELFTQQVYEYWRDLLDFRAQAAVGAIPSASLVISSWTAGGEPSNFVQVPAQFWDNGRLSLQHCDREQLTQTLQNMAIPNWAYKTTESVIKRKINLPKLNVFHA